jgi:hypothetical protein
MRARLVRPVSHCDYSIFPDGLGECVNDLVFGLVLADEPAPLELAPRKAAPTL